MGKNGGMGGYAAHLLIVAAEGQSVTQLCRGGRWSGAEDLPEEGHEAKLQADVGLRCRCEFRAGRLPRFKFVQETKPSLVEAAYICKDGKNAPGHIYVKLQALLHVRQGVLDKLTSILHMTCPCCRRPELGATLQRYICTTRGVALCLTAPNNVHAHFSLPLALAPVTAYLQLRGNESCVRA